LTAAVPVGAFLTYPLSSYFLLLSFILNFFSILLKVSD
jgi:hypothetical protein